MFFLFFSFFCICIGDMYHPSKLLKSLSAVLNVLLIFFSLSINSMRKPKTWNQFPTLRFIVCVSFHFAGKSILLTFDILDWIKSCWCRFVRFIHNGVRVEIVLSFNFKWNHKVSFFNMVFIKKLSSFNIKSFSII